MVFKILYLATPISIKVDMRKKFVHPNAHKPFISELQGREYQKRFRQSVSAYLVACLAVVTLIKDC